MANEQNLLPTTSISSFPREVLANVIARVAASSSTDLFRAKQCCKLFCEVSEESNVYRCVSLDKFDIVPWHKNHKVSRFLKMCRQYKNPEALYRKGVVDCFKGKNVEAALECLEEAVQSGHDEATYALGIIFLFSGDDCKQKGMSLLSGMKSSKIQKQQVKHCRDSLQRILRMIWVKNPVVLSQRLICCSMQHNRRLGS